MSRLRRPAALSLAFLLCFPAVACGGGGAGEGFPSIPSSQNGQNGQDGQEGQGDRNGQGDQDGQGDRNGQDGQGDQNGRNGGESQGGQVPISPVDVPDIPEPGASFDSADEIHGIVAEEVRQNCDDGTVCLDLDVEVHADDQDPSCTFQGFDPEAGTQMERGATLTVLVSGAGCSAGGETGGESTPTEPEPEPEPDTGEPESPDTGEPGTEDPATEDPATEDPDYGEPQPTATSS
ncbi:hypothetical protein [Planomonospora venezuelensis]|nr:hypothetical protein Pve01_74640 [Planomonospora venezuelensis]